MSQMDKLCNWPHEQLNLECLLENKAFKFAPKSVTSFIIHFHLVSNSWSSVNATVLKHHYPNPALQSMCCLIQLKIIINLFWQVQQICSTKSHICLRLRDGVQHDSIGRSERVRSSSCVLIVIIVSISWYFPFFLPQKCSCGVCPYRSWENRRSFKTQSQRLRCHNFSWRIWCSKEFVRTNFHPVYNCITAQSLTYLAMCAIRLWFSTQMFSF